MSEGAAAYGVLIEPVRPSAPFVSVVMRTQGLRMAAMDSALDSLEAQTDGDFELVVVAHDAEPPALDAVRKLLERHDGLAGCISLLTVEGGSRSRPLNAGFSHARGEYVLIFDDDDLLRPNWVAGTRAASLENPGRVIYSFVQTQEWDLGEQGEGPHPVSGFSNTYCRTFDVADLIRDNRCPTLGLAYPRRPLLEAGLVFDEEMDANEDWDYLLQAVLRCGLAINPEPTSIYRMWRTGPNSRRQYEREFWVACRDRLWGKLDAQPISLPAGSLNHLLGGGRLRPVRSGDAKLYIDTGEGFDEETMLFEPEVNHAADADELVYRDVGGPGAVVRAFRLDPIDYGSIIVEGFHVRAEFADGRSWEAGISQAQTNGFVLEDGSCAFPKSDPMIVLQLDEPGAIAVLRIKYRLRNGIDDEIMDRIFAKLEGPAEPSGGLKGAYRRLKGIFL